jgi:hypothetical protein
MSWRNTDSRYSRPRKLTGFLFDSLEGDTLVFLATLLLLRDSILR